MSARGSAEVSGRRRCWGSACRRTEVSVKSKEARRGGNSVSRSVVA